MVNSNLFQHSCCRAFTRFEQVYLQSNLDLLCESPLWEDSLYLWYHTGWHHASLRSYGMHLLTDSRHHSEVLGKVCGQNSGHAARGGLLQSSQLCKWIILQLRLNSMHQLGPIWPSRFYSPKTAADIYTFQSYLIWNILNYQSCLC